MSQNKRLVSFRTQRVIATLVIFAIVFFWTTSVLWSHLEGVIAPGTYQSLAKIGLLLVPAVATVMTLWELFVDDVKSRIHASHPFVVQLVGWCFWGSYLVAAAEVVHAGAILKLENSRAENVKTIAAIGDGLSKIAGSQAEGAMKGASAGAREANAVGQRQLARRTITAGSQAVSATNATAQDKFLEATKDKQEAETFLPEAYTDGGMYVALPLFGLICFAITMALGRRAQPFVDKDDDGVYDAEQGQAVKGKGRRREQEDWPDELDEDEEDEPEPRRRVDQFKGGERHLREWRQSPK
jgi:hypothetical protein